MRSLIYLTLALVFFASPTQASYLEICKFEGVVKKSSKIKDGAMRFVVKVESSLPAKCRTTESDDPMTCQSYINRKLKGALPAESSNNIVTGSKITIIQRVWYADAAPNPGIRASWELPGNCN